MRRRERAVEVAARPASCFGRARRPRTSKLGRSCRRFARAPRSGERLRRACPTAKGLRWRRVGTRHRAVRSGVDSEIEGRRPDRGHRGDRFRVVTQRYFQNTRTPNSRSPSRKVPVCLPISSPSSNSRQPLLLAGEHSQWCAHAVHQDGRVPAAELTGSLGGIFCDQVGGNEVARPYRAHHDMLGDEDVLALFAVLPHGAVGSRQAPLARCLVGR